MKPIAPDFLERVVNAVSFHGFGDDIGWAENLCPPASADEFAREVIFVICNSGMKNTVARGIYERVMAALVNDGGKCSHVFGYVGKVTAIGQVWRSREILFEGYLVRTTDEERLAYLESIPWIGGITKYHLAKNFGMQVAKPDVHLQRLANTFETTPQALCEALAERTGYKVATVDTLLWRAAALGLLNTRTGEFV